MKVLLTVLMAASLFACSAKVDAPKIDFPPGGAPLDDTPLNPTSTLDLLLTSGTTSNFNKFKLETSSTIYNVYYTIQPTANTTLFYDNEVRQTEGCTESSYDAAFEWRELNSSGAVVTTTPVGLGETYNLKKDVTYNFVVKLSKMACTLIRHSFLMKKQ